MQREFKITYTIEISGEGLTAEECAENACKEALKIMQDKVTQSFEAQDDKTGKVFLIDIEP